MKLLPAMDIEARRFWAKVRICSDAEACWHWQAASNKDGYGLFKFRGRHQTAQRTAYTLANGQEPGALFVCHTCDNPSCVNPSHLWLGTAADNNADKVNKGRANPPRGSRASCAKLTEDQVRAILQDARNGARIAAEYGVTRVAIHYIRHGINWAHISREEATQC